MKPNVRFDSLDALLIANSIKLYEQGQRRAPRWDSDLAFIGYWMLLLIGTIVALVWR